MVLKVLDTCQEVMNKSQDVQIVSSNITKLAEKVFFNIALLK